jgi:membrane protease YdiL (CAAX protease family)
MLSQKPWRSEFVLLFGAAIFACYGFVAIAALLLQKCGLAGFQNPDDAGFALLGTLGLEGPAWIFILVFLRLHKISVRDAFGLRAPGLGKSLLLAAGVLAVALPAVWLLQGLSGVVLEKIGAPVENQRAVDIFLGIKSTWFRLCFGFFAVAVAPVAEEFVFRGMLYPFVKQLGSPRAALFGVSAIFAAIHFDAGTFVPLFALALALTWLYEKTDRLLAPIAAHSLFNAANLAALYFLPQINEFLQKSTHVQLLK